MYSGVLYVPFSLKRSRKRVDPVPYRFFTSVDSLNTGTNCRNVSDETFLHSDGQQ